MGHRRVPSCGRPGYDSGHPVGGDGIGRRGRRRAAAHRALIRSCPSRWPRPCPRSLCRQSSLMHRRPRRTRASMRKSPRAIRMRNRIGAPVVTSRRRSGPQTARRSTGHRTATTTRCRRVPGDSCTAPVGTHRAPAIRRGGLPTAVGVWRRSAFGELSAGCRRRRASRGRRPRLRRGRPHAGSHARSPLPATRTFAMARSRPRRF